MRRRQPKTPPKIKRKYIVLLVLLALLAAAGWYGYREFQRQTQPVILNNAGRTYELKIPNAETKRFDQSFFSFELPADWKQVSHNAAPYNLYSFQSTLKNADNRYLDIYADSIPVTLAVNKVVALKSQGNNLSHGMVSDNCMALLPAAVTAGTPKQLAIPAKWDGVEFICDNDRTTRNVVGTSAPGSINKVSLKGPTGVQHSFFFVYTDNNYTPEYTIFYKMLESLTVK